MAKVRLRAMSFEFFLPEMYISEDNCVYLWMYSGNENRENGCWSLVWIREIPFGDGLVEGFDTWGCVDGAHAEWWWWWCQSVDWAIPGVGLLPPFFMGMEVRLRFRVVVHVSPLLDLLSGGGSRMAGASDGK